MRGIFLFISVILYNGGMESNYNQDYYKDACPQYSCKKKCECGLEFVSIPAAMESKTPPVDGLYCNAIVRYEGSGRVYIYSKEGVPVLVKEGDAS